MKKVYHCTLHTLSPVHIGCGQEYDPMNSRIDPVAQKLISYNPLDLVNSLDDKSRGTFKELCLRTGRPDVILMELYRFAAARDVAGRQIPIPANLAKRYSELVLQYKERSYGNKPSEDFNRFRIERQAFSSLDNAAYIPGSSLKGAFRTAFLEIQARKNKVSDYFKKAHPNLVQESKENNSSYHDSLSKLNIPQRELNKKFSVAAKQMEENLLNGSFETDPFRLVKVSDFMPANPDSIKMRIYYLLNILKPPNGKTGRAPYQVLEAIGSISALKGRITIDHGNHDHIRIKLGDDFFKMISERYESLRSKEAEDLKKLNLMDQAGQNYARFRGKFHGSPGYLLRIGRHSGAEAVTLESNRLIYIMPKKGEKGSYKPEPTTFWLAGIDERGFHRTNLIPMGWVGLVIDQEETIP